MINHGIVCLGTQWLWDFGLSINARFLSMQGQGFLWIMASLRMIKRFMEQRISHWAAQMLNPEDPVCRKSECVSPQILCSVAREMGPSNPVTWCEADITKS